MKTELPIIHTLRGFSAVGICLYHYVCCTTGYVGPGIVFDTFALLALNVQIFFVISAMVIPISMINAQYRIQDFFTFVYKRALRIEPPYLISLLIAAAYLTLRNYIPGSASVDLAPGWDELLMHIGYLVPFFEDARWINPVYWSLSVEFQYYILLGLLFPLAMHSMVWLRILFYALLLIGPFVSYQSSFFTSWSSLFLLGILYILQYLKKINRVEFWIFLIAASVITYWKVGPNDLLVGLLALLVIHFFRNFDFKIGRYFGDRSFSIYLLHSITGAPIINFLSHRYHEAWQKPLVIVFGFFICLICSHYFHRWVEMPSLRLSKKINYTRGS
jgi:peptidoglycan/LPS O-acetylase OafA/YrhL